MSYYDTSYPPSLWTIPPPPIPTAISLNPASMVVGGGLQPVVVTGTNFTINSVINIDGAPVSTVFTSPTQIYTDYDPTTVGIYSVTVVDGSNTTSALSMAVTASGETFTAVPVDKTSYETETDEI